MKLAISAYSYHQMVESGEITWLETVRRIAAHNVDGIEFAAFDAPEDVCKFEYAEKLSAACKTAGLPVVCYSIHADFLTGSGKNLDAEVERLDEELKIAQILGTKLMRHDVTWSSPRDYYGVPSFENQLVRLAEGTRRVTEKAAALGIRTCTENHGYYMQGAERVARLCAAVDHPNYGLLADVGNFICADEDGAVALGQIMPMVFHVHIKDMFYRSGGKISPGRGWGRSRGGNFFKGAVIGHGDTPVVPALRILKNAGYGGYVAVEYGAAEHSDLGVEISMENLRRFIKIVDEEN